jgi:hypothetical protein
MRASLDRGHLEVFKQVRVVFLLPLLVSFVDPRLHLLQRTLKHTCKHLAHIVYLLFELADLLLLILFNGHFLLFELRVLVFQLFNGIIVAVNFSFKEFLLLS